MEQTKVEDLVKLMNTGELPQNPNAPQEPKPFILEKGRFYGFFDASGRQFGKCMEIIESGLIFRKVEEVHFLMKVNVGNDVITERIVCYRRNAIDCIYEI